jgi:dinuclear metal center YbgI/SA1388 family protein
MVKAEWVIQKMENWAPLDLAEEWDNPGLLIGDSAQDVRRILVALDASESVISETLRGKYDLLITHHPLIYNPLKRIISQDPTGSKIIRLIQNKTGLYCAHTNLDIAEGGVNDILFDILELNKKENLMESELGRVGYTAAPMKLMDFADYIKNKLNISDVRFFGEPSKIIHKIGLCAGDAAGQRYVRAALQKNCDVYITGDLRYHGIMEALEQNLSLIDISHYGSEVPIVSAIAKYLMDEAEKEKLHLITDTYTSLPYI